MSEPNATQASVPEEQQTSPVVPTIVISESPSLQTRTKRNIKEKWFVLAYLRASGHQHRPPLDPDASEASIDDTYAALLSEAQNDTLTPDKWSVLNELCLRDQERRFSQFALFKAGHQRGLDEGVIAVTQLGSLPTLSKDFTLQSVLDQMPTVVCITRDHKRKSSYLANNLTAFDIDQIVAHIENQPGTPSYAAYHSELAKLSGREELTAAEASSTALHKARLDPAQFLSRESIGHGVDEWFRGS